MWLVYVEDHSGPVAVCYFKDVTSRVEMICIRGFVWGMTPGIFHIVPKMLFGLQCVVRRIRHHPQCRVSSVSAVVEMCSFAAAAMVDQGFVEQSQEYPGDCREYVWQVSVVCVYVYGVACCMGIE